MSFLKQQIWSKFQLFKNLASRAGLKNFNSTDLILFVFFTASVSTDTPPLHAMKQEAESANSGSELERAMAATLKNLEVMPPTTSEIKNEDERKSTMSEDYEAELKK